MSRRERRSFIGWFSFRLVLLLLVGGLLWGGFRWWQGVSLPPQALEDSQIEAAVLAEIGRRALVDLLHVKVAVTRGQVALSGKVRLARDRDEVVRLAREVPGVAGVTSRLVLDPALRTPDEVRRDALLAARVKGALAMEEGVRGLGIKVETHRGTVTLEGEVLFPEQRDLTTRIVAGVSGVVRVVNKLSVHGNK